MSESWNDGVRGAQVPPLINSDADTIRCVAGPGSGKTFGLVRRVERLLHPAGLAADGRDVLVVAFNRVIAGQLREDISARLKTFDYKHAPVIRTIHTLCVEVIGEELRMLLPHEVDAMIYDVLNEYLAVAELYEDFYDAAQALRDHEAGHPESHPPRGVGGWLRPGRSRAFVQTSRDRKRAHARRRARRACGSQASFMDFAFAGSDAADRAHVRAHAKAASRVFPRVCAWRVL